MPSAGPSNKHRRFGSEEFTEEEDQVIYRPGRVSSPALETDDEDAPPEAVSLGAGKEEVTKRDKILRENDLRTARLRKEANKAKAAELKARKDVRESMKVNNTPPNRTKKGLKAEARRKGDSKGANPLNNVHNEEMDSEPVDRAALARMQRAMAQAESEDDDEDDGEGSWGGVQDSIQSHSQAKPLQKAKTIPDRLPDSVFQAAKMAIAQEKEDSDEDMSSEPQLDSDDTLDRGGPRSRKAQHPRNRPKDVIVGSRTVRPLATTKQLGLHISLQRPQAVREFRNKSLNVDGQIEHKPWQRVETHLAVRGKRLGPAKNFAQAHRLRT
ncbi:hypothetical protein FRC04_004422 [Tulasnella sp. 424]|nr:hypothetical protein FRC04_004422 [Tulasnella sp. 424]KAG8979534.1 hypothetical protein FRC05_008523 [Tulasnella sp. 425]